MLMHAVRHEDVKRFKCDVCGKLFHAQYGLNVHRRSHFDVYPYSCNFCKRKFRHICTLKVILLAISGEHHSQINNNNLNTLDIL